MSYSISTLLTRNLHGVFGENDPARRRAAIDEIFTEDCVFYEPRAFTVAATRSITSRARSRLLTLTFQYQPSLRCFAASYADATILLCLRYLPETRKSWQLEKMVATVDHNGPWS
jgi:hypothetical protein